MAGWREVEVTKNRLAIHDMLTRARRFHAPVTGSLELDITDARARIREDRRRGRKVSLIAFLLRATAMTVRRFPSLHRHLFTTWYGRRREVVFDEISCTVIVARKGEGGEELVLPVTVRRVDEKTIEELAEIIQHHRTAPLAELEQVQAIERIKRAPRLALTWFSYKARSDPAFYLKYFGTYGLSSLMDPGGPVHAMATYANTAVAFLPSTIRERPWVVNGQIVPREILNLSSVVDHFLIDGNESLRIAHALQELVESPEKILGPPHAG